MHESTVNKTQFVWRLEVSCVEVQMRTASPRDHVCHAFFAENWTPSGYTQEIFQDKQPGGRTCV